MPRIIVALLIQLLTLLPYAPVIDGQGNKPIKEITSQPDYIEPPATLNETWLSTELIVQGKVMGAIPKDKAMSPGRTSVRTGFRVRVLQVFRAPAGIELEGDEILVLQSGGDRDRGAHIERVNTDGFPLLRQGREYVLFLTRAEKGAWGSAYGPDGVYEKSGDVVVPFGQSQTSLAQKDLRWNDFIRILTNSGIR